MDSTVRKALHLVGGGPQELNGATWAMKQVCTADAILCSVRSRKISLYWVESNHIVQEEKSLEEFEKLPGHVEAMRRCLWQLASVSIYGEPEYEWV